LTFARERYGDNIVAIGAAVQNAADKLQMLEADARRISILVYDPQDVK
jgi:hypothetical protein